MRYRLLLPGALTLGALTLAAACGDSITTDPTPAEQPGPPDPALAATTNTWIFRANMWSVEPD
jgi:hypothetical protein